MEWIQGMNVAVNYIEEHILEWLPTSGYEYANAPEIELYLDPEPAQAKLKEVVENMDGVIRMPGGIYNFGGETKKTCMR